MKMFFSPTFRSRKRERNPPAFIVVHRHGFELFCGRRESPIGLLMTWDIITRPINPTLLPMCQRVLLRICAVAGDAARGFGDVLR